jgi:hypothetical protein
MLMLIDLNTKETKMKMSRYIMALLVVATISSSLYAATPADRFREALRNQEFDKAKNIIAEKGFDANDTNGTRPIVIAIFENNNDLLKELIKAGANVNVYDDFKDTPLLRAVIEDGTSSDIIQTLLKNKADTNIRHSDKTALDIAKEKLHAMEQGNYSAERINNQKNIVNLLENAAANPAPIAANEFEAVLQTLIAAVRANTELDILIKADEPASKRAPALDELKTAVQELENATNKAKTDAFKQAAMKWVTAFKKKLA